MLLLNQTLSKKLEKPFIYLPPDSALPLIQPCDVTSKLSKSYHLLIKELSQKTQNDSLKELEGKQIVKTVEVRNETDNNNNNNLPLKPSHKLNEEILNKSANYPDINNSVQYQNKIQIDWKSQAEIVRLQSEINVLQITVKHLKEEIYVNYCFSFDLD